MLSLLTALVVAALHTTDPAPLPIHQLDPLLARPVSPGVIALLFPHLADERATARVIEAVSHDNPAVRAAAARVAGVASLAPALPTLRRALESETDRSAATEQIRAMVLLSPARDALSLIATARKHAVMDLFAHVAGGVGGPAILTSLEALTEAGLTEAAERSVIVSSTRRGREALSIVAVSALRTRSTARWATVLALARQPGAVLSPGLLVAGIGSAKAEIRALTYWHLALTLTDASPLSPEVEAALASTPDSEQASPASVDAAFALAALRRAQRGVAGGGDWGERISVRHPILPLDADGRREPIARYLTKAEARALGVLEEEKTKAIEPGAKHSATQGGLWFAGGLPPGTLRDMLLVTGCKPVAGQHVAGLVEYRRDGRPRRVAVADSGLSRRCAEAVGPTLGLTLAPPGLLDVEHPERSTVVIVPLDEESLECAEQPEPSTVERVREEDRGPGSGKIKEPRKIRNVPPRYPAQAKAEGLQGTVVLEAIISPTGCVRAARVLHSLSPPMDAAAMIAVGGWRYTPTLLDGKPVPVIMTVTINYKLSR